MSLVRFLKKVAVDFLLVILARPDCHEVNEAIPRFQKFLPHFLFTVPPVIFNLAAQLTPVAKQNASHATIGAVGRFPALT